MSALYINVNPLPIPEGPCLAGSACALSQPVLPQHCVSIWHVLEGCSRDAVPGFGLHLVLLIPQLLQHTGVVLQVGHAARESGAGGVMARQQHQQQVAADLNIC